MFAPVIVNGKARSLMTYEPRRNVYASDYSTYCEANGNGWQLDDWSNVCMIRDLAELLCRSTNTQKHYGTGPVGGLARTNGELVHKGEFWGSSGTNSSVKIFWLENIACNIARYIRGILSSPIMVKMYPPYGNFENSVKSSTEGYINTGLVIPGKYGQVSFITTTIINEYGTFPTGVDGTGSTYACDILYFDIPNIFTYGTSYRDGDRYCGGLESFSENNTTQYEGCGGSLAFKAAS